MTLSIYLGDDFSHFKSGLAIFDDGKKEELQDYVHQGMLVDTLLLGTAKEMTYGSFLLRWRIYPSSIEIYDIAPEVTQIIFKNKSQKNICIDKHTFLAPEKTLIMRNS